MASRRALGARRHRSQNEVELSGQPDEYQVASIDRKARQRRCPSGRPQTLPCGRLALTHGPDQRHDGGVQAVVAAVRQPVSREGQDVVVVGF